MINQKIINDIKKLNSEFLDSKPFKHIKIDNFLQDNIVDQLCIDFPKFDNDKAKNEHGNIGPKCVHTDLKSISPFYKDFYEYISSYDFLSTIEQISGIDNLVFDHNMYGAGTHENVSGAELDVHVDFNYDSVTKFHRRLNLLIYLNDNWEEDWGGAIDLFASPISFYPPKPITFNCIKNRCVIFETNEHSWHGFRKINIPEDKRDSISRKLISIYLYTKDRPEDEIFPEHGTFYFPYQPDLPQSADFDNARRLIHKRDLLLMYCYQRERDMSGQMGQLHQTIAMLNKKLEEQRKV